jgi:predicted enzyme related to lactoylglutathione lyase
MTHDPDSAADFYARVAGWGAIPHWLYYIMVPDIDAAVATVKELGGQLLNGPEVVPGGDKVAQCLDPQGAHFALHSKEAGEG